MLVGIKELAVALQRLKIAVRIAGINFLEQWRQNPAIAQAFQRVRQSNPAAGTLEQLAEHLFLAFAVVMRAHCAVVDISH